MAFAGQQNREDRHCPPYSSTVSSFQTLKLCVGGGRVDANLFAVLAPAFKGYNAVDQGEQGIVSATTDVISRMKLGTALADQDIPSRHDFAAVAL